MCGIAGAITPQPINQKNINNVIKELRKRGPDAYGTSTNQSLNNSFITLIHTRLSILDINKRSNQPIRYKNINLIFNGEIYNYLELKKNLKRKFNFTTNSDTEVLLKLIHDEGISSLKKCEGMFALTYFDFSNNKLFLARDRFGEKPLYYFHRSDGSFFFGSEPKAIFALLGHKLPVDINHIRRFLINGYKSIYKQNYTYFKGLEELKPGYCMEIEPFKQNFYYPWISYENNFQETEITYEEAVNGTRERLLNSMEIRLRSNRGIIAFMPKRYAAQNTTSTQRRSSSIFNSIS